MASFSLSLLFLSVHAQPTSVQVSSPYSSQTGWKAFFLSQRKNMSKIVIFYTLIVSVWPRWRANTWPWQPLPSSGSSWASLSPPLSPWDRWPTFSPWRRSMPWMAWLQSSSRSYSCAWHQSDVSLRSKRRLTRAWAPMPWSPSIGQRSEDGSLPPLQVVVSL